MDILSSYALFLPVSVIVWFCGKAALDSIRRRNASQRRLLAYLSANYTEMLKTVEGLRAGGRETAPYLFFRGSALFQLGELREAETSLRKSMALDKTPYTTALCEDELGQVLLEQARYNEALDCFTEAAALWPRRGGSHRSIATLLLRRGGPAADAFRWAHQALEIDGQSELPAMARNINLAESHATLAWAVAAYSGAAAEVEHLLTRAFTLCPESYRPIRAQLHYFAGRAYAALHKTEESADEFERAARTDPNGNFGRLALAALTASTAAPPQEPLRAEPAAEPMASHSTA